MFGGLWQFEGGAIKRLSAANRKRQSALCPNYTIRSGIFRDVSLLAWAMHLRNSEAAEPRTLVLHGHTYVQGRELQGMIKSG